MVLDATSISRKSHGRPMIICWPDNLLDPSCTHTTSLFLLYCGAVTSSLAQVSTPSKGSSLSGHPSFTQHGSLSSRPSSTLPTPHCPNHLLTLSQRRHELEGAPDPFPSLSESTSVKPKAQQPRLELDTESEAAFPSLAPAAPATTVPARSAWSAGPRITPSVSKQPIFVDSFTLSAIDLSNAGKDGKTATLGEVMKQVMAKYKVKLEASANQKACQTTFHIKAESQKELDKAKRSLLALLSPVVCCSIHFKFPSDLCIPFI